MDNEQTNSTDWLNEEAKTTTSTSGDFEKLEPLKLEQGKIVSFKVDFSKQFRKWTETKNGKTLTKAIIPVLHKDTKKNLWLNVQNPLYQQIISKGIKGQTEFKVSTTGTQSDTRYTLVEEE